MKKSFLIKSAVLAASALFFLTATTSCDSGITLTATSADKANLTINLGYSDAAISILKDLISAGGGSIQDDSLVSAAEISSFLKNQGLSSVSSTSDKKGASARGIIPSISSSSLAHAGILLSTENSMTLTFGPEQIVSVYQSMEEANQGTMDLLMIPALTGETMSLSDYSELLGSVYGPELAQELVKGKMNISLSSPDGKKTITDSISIGELLTLNQEKSWSVKW